MSDVAERNRASVERLRVAERYVTQMRSLERILDEFRYNLSKTKSVVGFALAEAGLVNTRELDPSKCVSVSAEGKKLVFSLEDVEPAASTADQLDSGLRQRTAAGSKNKADKGDYDDNKDDGFDESRQRRRDSSERTPTVFRPFGLLEPNNAKLARRNIANALPLVCELASLQQKLRQLDDLHAGLAERMAGLSVDG